MLIEVAGYFEHAMVLGGIPFFANLFGIDYAAASWIITIFMLTGAASAIVGGKLGDMYGRKRMVLILLTISIIGSLITIAFASFPALLVGRALQGTSAGILPLLIGIARQVLPAKRVPVVIAMMTAVATITGGVGLFIAGMFIDAGAWRLMFAASATFCLLALLAAWWVLPRVQAFQTGTIDWVGATLLAPSLIVLLYGLSTASKSGFDNPLNVVCIVVGVAMLAVWTWWELRATSPLVDIRLLISPRTGKTMLATLLAGLAPLSAYTVYSPLIALSPAELPIGLGMTSTMFGLIAMVGSGVTLAMSPLAGVLARKRGAAVALIVGVGMMIVHFAGLMLPLLHKSIPAYIVLSVLATVGTAFIMSSVYNLIIESVPAESTSEYVGIAQVIRNATTAITTVIVSAMLSSSVVPGTTAPTTTAWNMTMLYVITVSVLVILVALLIQTRRRQSRFDGTSESDQVAVSAH
ncbi:MFS transporter [Rhodococcus koreensis]|nr:MFS transporter [Rhodococcus koreensis]